MSCTCGKIQHQTREAAEKHLAQLLATSSETDGLNVYKCPSSPDSTPIYHVGHSSLTGRYAMNCSQFTSGTSIPKTPRCKKCDARFEQTPHRGHPYVLCPTCRGQRKPSSYVHKNDLRNDAPKTPEAYLSGYAEQLAVVVSNRDEQIAQLKADALRLEETLTQKRSALSDMESQQAELKALQGLLTQHTQKLKQPTISHDFR